MKKLLSYGIAVLLIVTTALPVGAKTTIDINWLDVEWWGSPTEYVPKGDMMVMQAYVNDKMSYGIVRCSDGEIIVPFEYNYIGEFSEGIGRIEGTDGKFGFINSDGQIITEIEYDTVGDFHDGMAQVFIETETGVKGGFIDISGQVVVPAVFDATRSFHDGVAIVELCSDDGRNSYFGLIDKTGEYIVYPEFYWIDTFSEGIAGVVARTENGLKAGYMDISGQMTIAPEYDDGYSFAGGFALVGMTTKREHFAAETKYGFINTKGQLITELEYDMARSFQEGMAAVCKEDENGESKWGFINTNGDIAVPLIYDRAYDGFYDNGIALVGKDSQKGAINKAGEIVIPLEYDDIAYLGSDLIWVKSEGKDGIIDGSGEIIVPLGYNQIDELNDVHKWLHENHNPNEAVLALINNKTCIINGAKEIIELQDYYNKVEKFNSGLAKVTKNTGRDSANHGFINVDGEEVIPCEYGRVENLGEGGMVWDSSRIGFFKNMYITDESVKSPAKSIHLIVGAVAVIGVLACTAAFIIRKKRITRSEP